MAGLELDDIQGIIFSGYGHLPYSAYLFLHFDDPVGARRWLSELAERVTTSDWSRGSERAKRPEVAVNVALTASGLATLGLGQAALNTFPQEFLEGMAKPPRPRRLGDTGASAPEHWEFGGDRFPTAEEIHALLILQAPRANQEPEREMLDRLCAAEETEFKGRSIREVVLPRHLACQDRDGREHFGFRDAISQPEIKGGPKRSEATPNGIEAGEFILGYQNEYDVLPQTPIVTAGDDRAGLLPPHEDDPEIGVVKDLGHNGSYLVLRKLAQDVAGFRRFLRDNSSNPAEMARLGAKLMGRWASGAPLVLTDTDDPTLSGANDFGYAEEDPHGYRCPMASHIRRANPRDALFDSPDESRRIVNRHRILRRGTIYGERLPDGMFEDDGQARGVLFLCINADIERQFEFLQQTWINNPKFGGHYSDRDPITGPNADPSNPQAQGPWTMTIPGEPIRHRLTDVPRFVTMRGGGYFFLPSLRALRFLVELRSLSGS